MRARLLAAWEHVREVPRAARAAADAGGGARLLRSVEPVEVLYAKATLRAGDVGYGVLLASWGVGMVLGSIVFARAVRALAGADADVVGTLAVGLAYLGFAAAPTLALACARGAGGRRRQRRAVGRR